MTAILILSGSSEEELRSPQAIQVIATAISARVPPRISTCLSPSQSSPLSLSVPCGDGPPGTLVSVPAMLRTLHSLYYAGEDPVADAEVFAFVDHCSNELAEPLLAHDAETASQVTADAKAALEGLEKSLEGDKTFICSTPQASAADFAWGAWVEHARVLLGEALPLGERTIGWLATVMHQPSYVATKEAMKSSAEFTLPKEAASDTPSRGPDPTPQLFKRDRTRIFSVLATPPGANITVAGWARTIRKADKGRLIFIELNDGSSPQSLQCVLTKEAVEEGDNVTENFECALPVNSGGTGSSFRLTGTIVKSHGAGQAVELVATSVELLGAVYAGDQAGTKIGATFYPLSKKGHTLEHMRSVAHLRARAKVHSSAMRIRHAMAYATHRFFHENGFLYIHTPIVTCADCEGAGEQFGVTTLLSADHLSTNIKLPYVPEPKPEDSDVKKKKDKKKKKAPPIDPHAEPPVPNAVDYSGDFFGKRANLTVSGQLNVETHCMALSDVYTFGPTFRAEQSHTARHLCEFWMIEPEVAFADLEMDVNLAEDYLKYCVKYALEMCAEDLEFFENSPAGEKDLRARLRNVLDNPFKRLSYTEAIKILQKVVADEEHKFEEYPEWGMDLGSEHERYLCEKIYKKPVVLTDYPKDIKAFYMKLNDDGKTVAAADILVPKIGEIIGGSQREHRHEVLLERCRAQGLEERHVWWYLELRKYGTVPHAGFGLGFERLILFVTGLDNIRDVIPFPRWPGNAEF